MVLINIVICHIYLYSGIAMVGDIATRKNIIKIQPNNIINI